MNLGEVKTRVKRQFGDESSVQVNDDDILRWANDGQRAVVMNNEALHQKISTIDVVANQVDYDLPSDLLLIKSVSYKIAGGLAYFHMVGYDIQKFNSYIDGWDGNIYGPGFSAVYTVFANKLKVFPVSAASLAAGLKVYYNRKPIDLVIDTDVIDLPEMYHNSIVDYCLQQAYELDEDWQTSQYKATQFQSDLKFNRDKTNWPNQEQYSTVTALPDDNW